MGVGSPERLALEKSIAGGGELATKKGQHATFPFSSTRVRTVGRCAHTPRFDKPSKLLSSARGLAPYRSDVESPAAHILIVEDHAPLVKGFARALNAGGYSVDSAADGLEGLGRLLERSYDAVVTDLNMPRMNGLDFLAKIRALQPGVPVILMTGDLDPHAYARARELGVVRYLLKPVRIEQLGRAVDNAVKLRAVWAKMQGRKTPSVP